MKSIILTFIQFASLTVMLILSPFFAKEIYLIVFQIIGSLIGIWAVITMSRSKLNITPDPLKGATLVEAGIYKLVRHPMYLSLLLFFAPLIISYQDLWVSITFATFTINIVFKLLHEEKLLKAYFKDYSEYMKRTWRIIPYIF